MTAAVSPTQRLLNLARSHRGLVALLTLYVALGIVYNVSLPLFEAPDEHDHLRYARWLGEHRRLPHMIDELADVGHELTQPPLYYALLAPLFATIDTADFDTVAPVNPHWRDGAGINVHYHTAAEAFPYRGAALATHLARLVSTLLGVCAVVSTYGIGRFVAPQAALMAAAFVALNPQFLFISSAVNNDTLVASLCGLALWLVASEVAATKVSPWRCAAVGALWGLAALSKTSGSPLGAILLVAITLAAWRRRSSRTLIVGAPAILAGAAVVAGWWFVRNWRLYGDPIAWQAVLTSASGLVRSEPLDWIETLRYSTFLHRSYWAMFAYGIHAPSPFYPVTNALAAIGLAGLGVWWAQTGRRRCRDAASAILFLQVAWSAMAAVALLNWMRQVEATDQGRLLFPAAASIAVLLGVGLSELARKRRWLVLLAAGWLGAWAAAVPFLSIQPAFARPRPLPADFAIPNPIPVRFGDDIALLGYGLPEESARAGDTLAVALYWTAHSPIAESYVVGLRVLDASGRVVAARDTIPYHGRYATPAWEPGQSFRDPYRLELDPKAAAGQATLLLSLYPWGESDLALPTTVGETPVGTTLSLTRFKIAQPATAYSPAHLAETTFGELARLSGYDAPAEITAGQPFTLTLYWEALQPDGRDYTVFAHLLDAARAPLAQADSPPLDGRFPTSIWAAGEQIRDPHIFVLPPDLPPGAYSLAVGVYDPASGLRLPALRPDGGRWANDSVTLTTLRTVANP